MAITCNEIDELAGAYALDALPADELEAVERHLSSCPEQHASLRDLVEVASLLAFTTEAALPPPELGRNILAIVTAEGGEPALTPSGPSPEPPAPVVTFPRREWKAGPFALAAAALALLAIGLGTWGLLQRNDSSQARGEAGRDRQVLAALASGATVVRTPATAALPAAMLVQPADGSPAYLVVQWPPATSGMSYQAWFIIQGQPASAGVFDGAGDAPQVVRLTRGTAGAQALAFTVEPHGGSAQPTSKPFVVQPLSS